MLLSVESFLFPLATEFCFPVSPTIQNQYIPCALCVQPSSLSRMSQVQGQHTDPWGQLQFPLLVQSPSWPISGSVLAATMLYETCNATQFCWARIVLCGTYIQCSGCIVVRLALPGSANSTSFFFSSMYFQDTANRVFHRIGPHLETASCISLHKHRAEDVNRQNCAETSAVMFPTQLFLPSTILPSGYVHLGMQLVHAAQWVSAFLSGWSFVATT